MIRAKPILNPFHVKESSEYGTSQTRSEHSSPNNRKDYDDKQALPDVRADVTSALHEHPETRVIFVVMEQKSPEARLLVDDITKETSNLRVIWHDGDLSATARELTAALAS